MRTIEDPCRTDKTTKRFSADNIVVGRLDPEVAPASEGLREPAPGGPETAHGDNGDGGSDNSGDPPGSQTHTPRLSRFAVRDDGALLLSLEDAEGRDLTGRRIVHLLELTEDEAARARSSAEDGLSAAAASILGRLPKTGRSYTT